MVLKVTPEDVQQALKDFAFSVRKMAEEAGTDCDVPGCNALTLGARCDNCSRRLCTTHAYWKFGTKMITRCPYCVVAENTQLFDDEDAEDGEDDEGADDVVDADYEEL